MSKMHSPGPKAREEEIERLRKLIDEGDADIAAGRVHRYANGKELVADIVSRGVSRLP